MSRRRRRTTLAGVLARAAAYALAALVLSVGALQVWYFAHVLYWAHFNPSGTAFMERRLAELREKQPSARLRQQWVRYEAISIHLKRAVVASEDARFVEHDGFDWEAIQKALERNEKRGRVVAGGSTITQQLAKNLFLSGERSWLRKAQEAAITWMLERAMSKRRILEIYLNVAEWGEGVFGAEAAARYHFGVPASSLRPEQAVYLAVILPSPRRYAPGRVTPYLAERVVTVHARMGAVQIP